MPISTFSSLWQKDETSLRLTWFCPSAAGSQQRWCRCLRSPSTRPRCPPAAGGGPTLARHPELRPRAPGAAPVPGTDRPADPATRQQQPCRGRGAGWGCFNSNSAEHCASESGVLEEGPWELESHLPRRSQAPWNPTTSCGYSALRYDPKVAPGTPRPPWRGLLDRHALTRRLQTCMNVG